MKPWYLGPLIIFLALGSSAQLAEGQRLSEGFRTHDVGSLLTQAQPAPVVDVCGDDPSAPGCHWCLGTL